MKKVKIILSVILTILIILIAVFLINKNQNKEKEQKIQSKIKNVIKVENLEFKDLNNNGKVDIYEDWREKSQERAKDLVKQMNLEEKAGMILINTQTIGKEQKDKTKTSQNEILDEEETSDESKIYLNKTGNTKTIEQLNLRHIIIRNDNKVEEIAIWVNEMQEKAEASRLGIPIVFTSNSKNELINQIYNYEGSNLTMYPGTLGIAAAELGEEKTNNGNSKVVENFAKTVKQEWNAIGLRKGYMYMADVATDPRWIRVSGTFGEDVNFVSNTIQKLVKGIQGEKLNSTSIALTLKHFPGSGARQNGLDPHSEKGKYAYYPTPESMSKYHLPPFETAIKNGVSSIMPYYSMPYEKNAVQTYSGETIKMEGPSFAFNSEYLNKLLRQKMEFKGYINTDSGVLDYISWGEEEKTEEEKLADAINAGTDLFSDTNKIELIKQAYNKQLITEETLNNSCERLLIEMFDLGLFENPYTNIEKSKNETATAQNIEEAYKTHLKSVTLLKNKENILPLKDEKIQNKKIYFKTLGIFSNHIYINEMIEKIKKEDKNIQIVESYEEADYAIIYINPSIVIQTANEYSNLDINYQSIGVGNLEKYQEICNKIHEKKGKVVTIVNFNQPWILKNIEPYADSIIAGYNTYFKAIYEVLRGKYNPIGILPFTLPANKEILEIDENGICKSPGDVPGYDKNKYLPEGTKYEYIDEEKNSYKLKYGLNY